VGDEVRVRREHHVPLGRAVRTVPIALRRLIAQHPGADYTDSQALVPVAQVNTRRHVHTILDATARRVLELADDQVQARRLLPAEGGGDAAGAVQTWREVELELLEGDRAVFDAVDAGLRAAGLTVSASASKVGRILGTTPAPSSVATGAGTEQRGTEQAGVEEGATEQVEGASASIPSTPSATSAPSTGSPIPVQLPKAPKRLKQLNTRSAAGDVVLAHLREQVQQILTQDPRVRADEADSVHKMRVATRRLRSALRTFQPLLQTPTKPLRDELRWLAAELGHARDAEVLRDRLVQSVASLDDEEETVDAEEPITNTGTNAATEVASDRGSVPQLVAEQLDAAYRSAHDEVLRELDGPRYQQLLASLQELILTPPLSTRAARSAQKVLPARVARTYRTLADLVAAAEETPHGHHRDELLHEARKAAKQVRYAAEAVATVFGRDAARFATTVTTVQEVLGEHQDSVVTRQRLRELATTSRPEVAFAYGRLYAGEETHAAISEEDFAEAWRAVQRKRLHRWLR
jgi:CHAD domain-containing protein